MANNYKIVSQVLSDATKTTVITAPSNGSCIVKSIFGANTGASDKDVDVFIYNDSDSAETTLVLNKTISAGSSSSVHGEPVVLESNDLLKLQLSGSGSTCNFQISYLEITR